MYGSKISDLFNLKQLALFILNGTAHNPS